MAKNQEVGESCLLSNLYSANCGSKFASVIEKTLTIQLATEPTVAQTGLSKSFSCMHFTLIKGICVQT